MNDVYTRTTAQHEGTSLFTVFSVLFSHVLVYGKRNVLNADAPICC
jgi:hypothetical protein